MSNWIKWWKNKDFLAIWGVILLSMGVCLGCTLINPDSLFWVGLGIAAVLCGGIIVKRIAKRMLDKIAERNNDKEA